LCSGSPHFFYKKLVRLEIISDDTQPYTLEELSARIDEAEAEIENGGGKSFKEMMDGFKQELVFGNRISGATVEG